MRLVAPDKKDTLQTSHGTTALMLAAANGFEKVVELALRRGAAIDVQNNAGDTALIRAACYGHPAALLRLLRAGADVTLRAHGHTALQFAKENGHTGCVRALED